jgi:hypothetical protein
VFTDHMPYTTAMSSFPMLSDHKAKTNAVNSCPNSV